MQEFERIVEAYYESLFRFALSLTGKDDEACDLTQETFYRWASKGGQLRDRSKVKSWLFTTLYRQYLGMKRRQTRLPHYDLDAVGQELPSEAPKVIAQAESMTVMAALIQVDELYRAPLTLFYLEDHSYREIARILNVPIGTVMSRISRGKELLRKALAIQLEGRGNKIIRLGQGKTGDGQV